MRQWLKLFFGLSLCCSGAFAGMTLEPPVSARVKILAVGDILLHEPLQQKAVRDGFKSLWREAIPFLSSADITFGNVEGPVARGVSMNGAAVLDPGHIVDKNVYSSYPRFNYHSKIAFALSESGFDIVSTANNHALDRMSLGVDRTIDSFKAAGLLSVGTRQAGASTPWYQLIEHNGIRMAWLACTVDTNGILDSKNQILYCYRKQDKTLLKNIVHDLREKVDAIFISPHWGVQYQQKPDAAQRQFAHELLEAGATAIIGSHPHCLQPVERYRTQDGRETLVAYSLGNFVSFQGTPKNRATILFIFDVVKRKEGHIALENVQAVPAFMENRSGEQAIHLKILSQKDKNTIGYRIIRQVLPDMPLSDSLYGIAEVQGPRSLRGAR